MRVHNWPLFGCAALQALAGCQYLFTGSVRLALVNLLVAGANLAMSTVAGEL
jgi:hypothetical protein